MVCVDVEDLVSEARCGQRRVLASARKFAGKGGGGGAWRLHRVRGGDDTVGRVTRSGVGTNIGEVTADV